MNSQEVFLEEICSRIRNRLNNELICKRCKDLGFYPSLSVRFCRYEKSEIFYACLLAANLGNEIIFKEMFSMSLRMLYPNFTFSVEICGDSEKSIVDFPYSNTIFNLGVLLLIYANDEIKKYIPSIDKNVLTYYLRHTTNNIKDQIILLKHGADPNRFIIPWILNSSDCQDLCKLGIDYRRMLPSLIRGESHWRE